MSGIKEKSIQESFVCTQEQTRAVQDRRSCNLGVGSHLIQPHFTGPQLVSKFSESRPCCYNITSFIKDGWKGKPWVCLQSSPCYKKPTANMESSQQTRFKKASPWKLPPESIHRVKKSLSPKQKAGTKPRHPAEIAGDSTNTFHNPLPSLSRRLPQTLRTLLQVFCLLQNQMNVRDGIILRAREKKDVSDKPELRDAFPPTALLEPRNSLQYAKFTPSRKHVVHFYH